MRKAIFNISLTILMLIPLMAIAEPDSMQVKSSIGAVIILSTNTLSHMQEVRKVIEEQGGTIEQIFPPAAFIGKVPNNRKDNLLQLSSIKEISYTKVCHSQSLWW